MQSLTCLKSCTFLRSLQGFSGYKKVKFFSIFNLKSSVAYLWVKQGAHIFYKYSLGSSSLEHPAFHAPTLPKEVDVVILILDYEDPAGSCKHMFM